MTDSTPTASQPLPVPNLKRKQRVLIVEDSEFVHQIYRVAFRKRGDCDVTHANHGIEGLAALDASGPVDLIIVDVNMPVMDGLSFVRELRKRPRDRETHVLLATTEEPRGDVHATLGHGPASFLKKPFNLSQLIAWLDSVLGGKPVA